MKISIVQSHPALLDIATTTRRLKKQLQECRDQEADLIILPELANSGYSFTSKEDAAALAEPANGNGPFLSFLSNYCHQYAKEIITGFAEESEEGTFNSAALIDENGIQSIYRKVHLFDKEKQWFRPGKTKPKTISRPWGTLSILICYDWAFPELWRDLALQGVDLIAHPCNLVLPYAQKAVIGHALCNRISIATANRVGTESFVFTGKSQFINSEGTPLCKASPQHQEVCTVEWNPQDGRDKRPTENSHLFHDRRAEIYGS